MSDCVFCRIVAGELPSKKVFETDRLLAFEDINPKAPVHLLLIPKTHVVNLLDGASDEPLMGSSISVHTRSAGRKDMFFPLRLLPRLPSDQACSVFRIVRVAFGLLLTGAMSHRDAIALYGPPTLGRPISPGLNRYHLIGLVGIVVDHLS